MSRTKLKRFEVTRQLAFFRKLQNKKICNDLHAKDAISKTYLELTANLVVKSECGGRWISVKCSCDNGKHRRLKMGGCMRENCVSCSESVNYRRFSKAFKRFKAKDYEQPIMCTNFTIPVELRTKALNIATWRYWVKCIIGKLKENYGFSWGLVSSHPTGKNKEIFHPHINVLWIQKRGFRHKLDLIILRADWGNIIKIKKEVVIYHRWVKKEGEKIHRINYVVRPFPGWKWWRGTSVRWYGEYPRGINIDPHDWICPDCGEKIEIKGVLIEYDKNAGRPVYKNSEIRWWSPHESEVCEQKRI